VGVDILAGMADSRRIVGAHVAPEHPLDEAAALGADCVQVFLSDPQGLAEPLREMIRAADAPVVCETPGTPDDMRDDLEFVREALAG
jgi:endonuclease IV